MRLHEWHKEVNACTLREVNAARDALNSKIKGFQGPLHGVADIPFFLYHMMSKISG